VAGDQLIELAIEDSVRLAANAVCVGHNVVLSACGDALRQRLAERGYRVVTTPLDSFLRSGGSAFCLTLRLNRRTDAARAVNAA
jgi:N-dimethylarginine dimethylaminohydrolase